MADTFRYDSIIQSAFASHINSSPPISGTNNIKADPAAQVSIYHGLNQNSIGVNQNNFNPQQRFSQISESHNKQGNDGLQEMMHDQEQPNDTTKDPSLTRLGRDKLTTAEMERFLGLELVALCAASVQHALQSRMTADMKEELERLYNNFQCDVVRLSIQNRVCYHLFFDHIGQNRRLQASGQSWNNFQKYDPAALKLFNKYGRDVGMGLVKSIWASKSGVEKIRYCDINYVTSLQEVITTPNNRTASSNSTPAETDPTNTETAETEPNPTPKNQKNVCLNEADLKSLAFFHQVKGFFVLASRHPTSPIFRKIGLPLGTNFLNMLAQNEKTDAAAEFHAWVAAQAIQINRGCKVVDPTKASIKPVSDIRENFQVGRLNKNVQAIRIKLKELISTASGGKLQVAWPGINCKEKLKEWKLAVKIDENDWNVTVNDIQRPLVGTLKGVNISILACLGLNKVHVTYHGNEPKVKDNDNADNQSSSGDLDTGSSGGPRERSQHEGCLKNTGAAHNASGGANGAASNSVGSGGVAPNASGRENGASDSVGSGQVPLNNSSRLGSGEGNPSLAIGQSSLGSLLDPQLDAMA
ncbi:hypothetical protein PCANC_27967 [Puccinia coronata f. sp. avenae]|uniref:Uncharacterized protein n=1 Tax=Puccinia coronata f. sp. avenae TaxID=200324 RepID=A0A2N5TFH5_9BASI|nr:hypothetical protein PCANC_27967 [Puccinia coronata f. sp. avenae]